MVLAVYNWPENTERYKKVARFVEKFFNKFENFHKPPRHPKWKTVNLAARIPGWTRFKAAEEWLQNAENTRPDKKKAFTAYLSQAGSTGRTFSETEKQVLFKQFSEWWESRQQ